MRLRPDFFAGNAEILWRAVTTKNMSCYLLYRQQILEQIREFDKELRVVPLGVAACDRICVKGDALMTLNTRVEGEGSNLR